MYYHLTDVCPPGYLIEMSDNCYMPVKDEVSWDEAMEYCLERNSTLMQIDHPSDGPVIARHFKKFFNDDCDMWMGLKQTGTVHFK